MRLDRNPGTINYAEGDVFHVSDRIVGVVTRLGTEIVCCHLFEVSEPDFEQERLDPAAAVAVVRVDDELLRDGTWEIIGEVRPWSRAAWPMPPFSVYWDAIPVASLTFYSEDDVAKVVSTRETDLETAKEFPVDQVYSSRHIETLLAASAGTLVDAVGKRADREVRAFFTVPTDAARSSLVRALVADGWETRVVSPAESGASPETEGREIVAWKFLPGVPDYSQLSSTREAVEVLASGLGGTLDGWETEIG